ncbi:hypothetical protein B0H34DRAFT_661928 [Crassisporium funariophilum]|nr:hypothetical protein B0H34DRAFT_661928 [Crassisporium funariophilum]
MRLLTNLGLLLSLCVTTLALHESDVGIVDWNKHLVGVPLFGSPSTAPAFHLVGNKSIILTATGNNVLAALEPEDGSVLWRYIFDPEDRIAGYYRHHNVVATLSGPGGSTLRTFDALTGQLVVEKRLHPPARGALSEPLYLGKHVTFSSDSTNLYVLSNGCTVSCIDGNTGDINWSWTSPDQSSLVIHSKLILTTDALYAVGVAKSMASYTLHVSTLSPATGEVIASGNIGSSIIDPLKEFTILSLPSSPRPVALWLEQGTLRYVGLTPTLKEKAKPIKGVGYTEILDVGLTNYGHTVIQRKDGSTFVLKLEGDVGSAKNIWEFDDSVTSEKNSDSMYAGVVDRQGQSYVARVYWTHKLQRGSADVFAGHLVSGQGLAAGFTFPFDTKTHAVINHVTENPYEWTINSRLLTTSSTGAVQLWQQDELKWTREESLAAVVVAEFVELPERLASGSSVGKANEGFTARIQRQILDAQDFPQYLVNFVKRFATGSYASPTSAPAAVSTSSNSTEGLSRDTFGFRQVIVAATLFGKVFGIDSSNGDILWSRQLGLGWAIEVGGTIHPVKLYVMKTVSDGGDPEVALVTQRRAENTLVDTVIYHFNAITGEDATRAKKQDSILEGHDVIHGGMVEGYLLQAETRIIVLLDEFLQVFLYPDNSQSQEVFAKLAPSLSFPLRTSVEGRRRVMGHQIDMSAKPLAYPTWSLSLPAGEEVQLLLSPAARGPVASIGKVLGNRTTLYKYLNPRLFTVLTASPTTSMCGIYVVDSMKGTVVYHAEVKSTIRGCEIKTALTENWLVYHYYEMEVAGGTVGGAKGYRMVSVEFYEGQQVDEKSRSSELSSFSNDTTNFMFFEKAFVFPHAVSALAPTSTKFGISTRDLIVATKNNRIQAFPRRLLDPRRPHRKPTTEESEEFLIQYDPVLPNDPQRVLSHNYDVANVQRIVAAPALLESTSLVFAFGLDMFLTRVAPSNTFDVLSENFNKVQLVFTVSGLILAILVTRPMVQRKRLREKWYQ